MERGMEWGGEAEGPATKGLALGTLETDTEQQTDSATQDLVGQSRYGGWRNKQRLGTQSPAP
jgi:hypothetical protein